MVGWVHGWGLAMGECVGGWADGLVGALVGRSAGGSVGRRVGSGSCGSGTLQHSASGCQTEIVLFNLIVRPLIARWEPLLQMSVPKHSSAMAQVKYITLLHFSSPYCTVLHFPIPYFTLLYLALPYFTLNGTHLQFVGNKFPQDGVHM